MTGLHLLMAVMATSRLTQIVTQDSIFAPIRKWFAEYNGRHIRLAIWGKNFVNCPYCVSVWAGLFCALMFYYRPFINWPFALSALFILISALMGVVESYRKPNGVIIFPGLDGVHTDWNGNSPQIAAGWILKVARSIEEQQKPQTEEDKIRRMR